MLSGHKSTWDPLKEALPRLEGLKAESGILYLQDPLQPMDNCLNPPSVPVISINTLVFFSRVVASPQITPRLASVTGGLQSSLNHCRL